MGRVSTVATAMVADLLRSDSGVPAAVAELRGEAKIDNVEISGTQILAVNISADLSDKAVGARYPVIHVYCEKVANRMTEKFRQFSGHASICMEIRVSQERTDELERRLQLYVDAVTQVLDNRRGEWADGMFYAGGYEIRFGGIRQGGKNFVQTATVAIQVDVSN